MATPPEPRLSLSAIGDFAALGAEWRALEAHAEGSFFQSWSWIGTWLEGLPADAAPLVARGAAGGETVALGILVKSRRGRHLLWRPRQLILNETGDDPLFIEHNGILAALRSGGAKAALRQLTATAEVDEIVLGGVPDRTAAIVPPDGWHRVVRASMPAFALDLASPGIADLSRFGRNTRAQIRGARHDYAAFGEIAVEAARDVPKALDFLAELKQLHQRHWQRRGRPGAFARPDFEDFHRRLIAACHDRGETELLRIRAGERTVGLLYHFIHRGRVHAYQSGFDYALLPHGRPGFLCHHLAIERHRSAGAAVYDFLAGDNRLKRSLSSTTTHLHWLTWQRETPAARIENALVAAAKRLRRR